MKVYKKKCCLSILLAILLVSGIGIAAAFAASTEAKGEPKQDWMFHDIVEVDFVQQYVKVPLPDGVMIIDSRPKRSKYDKGHIPMAVSIPDSQFDKMVGKLPADKSTLLIFYCEGLK